MVHSFNLCTLEDKSKQISEFMGSLVCTVSSRLPGLPSETLSKQEQKGTNAPLPKLRENYSSGNRNQNDMGSSFVWS